MDNAAAIGEKPQDVVAAPNQLTAYFTARVTFFEQLAANALPTQILLANFSGDVTWSHYCLGIQQVFEEAALSCPPIAGSTESNMSTMQSALAITMLGEQQQRDLYATDDLIWYTYGLPLVGAEVVEQAEDVAQVQAVFQAWQKEVVQQVWPVGSKGLQAEFSRLFGERTITCPVDCMKTAGPCTIVLLGIRPENEQLAKHYFQRHFHKLTIG
ncbi:hypothetical protein LYSBPC_19990 [Lysinibacillus piscis]|uniref:Alpha-ribazole-5-phosphate synthase n=2 Tax=Lysinibacillus piscis TaxID=2518931 RepID=A0ABQ5NKI5_9BACI|nr:hypothetical protein LYSBPC_19990 [Lysinibacillus sp. KH24]